MLYISTLKAQRWTDSELKDLEACMRFLGYQQQYGGESKAIKEAIKLVTVNYQRIIDDFEDRYSSYEKNIIRKHVESDKVD